MSNNSKQVTALIEELQVLNRADSASAADPPALKEVEGRNSKRKKLRQDLVQVLNLHDGE